MSHNLRPLGMMKAMLQVALLLSASWLLVIPVVAQGENAPTIIIDELGAFNNTNTTHIDAQGLEVPVLFVGETFHVRGQLMDDAGQGIGMKCLNIYVEPDVNETPLTTVQTDEEGRFDWFSGEHETTDSPPSILEPIEGEHVGFSSIRVAFEPQKTVEGGCEPDDGTGLSASHIDAAFLLKSRVDVLNLGVDIVQPEGRTCEDVECPGVYPGGAYALNLRLMLDRYDEGVPDAPLTYQTVLKDQNGLVVSSIEDHVAQTNSTGHARLLLNISSGFCCDFEGLGEWNIVFNGSPFYVGHDGSSNVSHSVNVQAVIVVSDAPEDDDLHDEEEDEVPSDDDGDGVPNSDDACPASALNSDVDENGCEEESTVETVEMFVLESSTLYSSDVSVVAFNHNGSEYATIHAGFCQAKTCFDEPTNSVLRFWNTSTQTERLSSHVHGHVIKMDWSPDGSTVALLTSDNIVAIHNTTDGKRMFMFMAARSFGADLAFNPDGSMLAVVSSSDGEDAGRIEVYSALDGAFIQRLNPSYPDYDHNTHYYSVDWSPDGERLLVGGFKSFIEYNVSDWVMLRTVDGVYSYITELAYSPDQSMIATCIGWSRNTPSLLRSGYAPSQVRVYDALTGSMSWSYESTASCLNLAWSPDSESVAFSHSKHSVDASRINIFNASTGAKIVELATNPSLLCEGDGVIHCAKVTGLDWHPEEDRIVSTQSNNSFGIYHWVLESVEVVRGCTNPYSQNFNPSANQDDGRCLDPEDSNPPVFVPNGPVFVVSDRRQGAPSGYSLAEHEMMFEELNYFPNGECYDLARSVLDRWQIVNLDHDWIIDGAGYGNKVYQRDASSGMPYDTLYKLDNAECTSNAQAPGGYVNPGFYTGGGGYSGGGGYGGDVGFPAITDSNGGMNFGCIVLCTPGEWAVLILIVSFALMGIIALMAPTGAFRATSDQPGIIREQENDEEGDIPPPVIAEPDVPPPVREQEPKPVLIGWLDDVD